MADGESVIRSLWSRIGTSGRRIDRSRTGRLKRWVLFDGNRERVVVALLTSYILRAATVTKLSPEEGPFVLDSERETAYDMQERDR